MPAGRFPAGIQSQNDYPLRPVAINVQVSHHHHEDRSSFDHFDKLSPTQQNLKVADEERDDVLIRP